MGVEWDSSMPVEGTMKNQKKIALIALFGLVAAVALASTITIQIVGNYSSSATVIAIQTPQLPQFQNPNLVGSYPATWFSQDQSRKELVYITGMTPAPNYTPGLIPTPPVFVCTRGYGGTTAFTHNGSTFLKFAARNTQTATQTTTPSRTPTVTFTPTATVPTSTPTINPTTVTMAKVDGSGNTFPSNYKFGTSYSGLQYLLLCDPPAGFSESGLGNASTDPFGLYNGGILELEWDWVGNSGFGGFRVHAAGSNGALWGDHSSNFWLEDLGGQGLCGNLIADKTARFCVAPSGTPTPMNVMAVTVLNASSTPEVHHVLGVD